MKIDKNILPDTKIVFDHEFDELDGCNYKTSDRRKAIEQRFGHQVRVLRETQELTQHELAEKTNLHQGCISEIEKGRRNVTLRVIESIAKAFGVHVKDLFR